MTWQLMLGKNLLWVAKQHGHTENSRLAVPLNPLASPLLAVDLAVGLFLSPPNR